MTVSCVFFSIEYDGSYVNRIYVVIFGWTAVVWRSVDLVHVEQNAVGTETIYMDLTSDWRPQRFDGDWLPGRFGLCIGQN